MSDVYGGVQGRRVPGDTPLGAMMLRRGILQYRLAADVGISPRLLRDYLHRRRKMSMGHKIRLARYFDAPPAIFDES